MKKIYKVPVFKIEGVGPYNLSFIDDIIVSKNKFSYKELFTKYNITCIDSQFNVESCGTVKVVIFKKDFTEDNIVDSDKFIEYSANAPFSNWRLFYDNELKKEKMNKSEEKVMKKTFKEIQGTLK